jgi:hypothetical protein
MKHAGSFVSIIALFLWFKLAQAWLGASFEVFFNQ